MKIPSTLASVGKSPDSGRAKSVGQRPAPAAAAPTDQVELSTLSARLQEAGAALDDTPVADAAHVAEIKQAIEDKGLGLVPLPEPTPIVYWWNTWVRPSGQIGSLMGRSANASS